VWFFPYKNKFVTLQPYKNPAKTRKAIVHFLLQAIPLTHGITLLPYRHADNPFVLGEG
jgi:hypothetical protein